MIKPNVNIIEYNSLYKILHEIKDVLPFNISNFDNEKNFNKEENFDSEIPLIITNPNNKNLIKKNILAASNLPIALDKLIELINIHLIKLKFNYQSKINIRGYDLNLNSKFFSKNGIKVKLTEKEIKIILYIVANQNKKTVLELQKNIWGYAEDLETHTVETHIYRLRKKMAENFNDKNFIISKNDGYFID